MDCTSSFWVFFCTDDLSERRREEYSRRRASAMSCSASHNPASLSLPATVPRACQSTCAEPGACEGSSCTEANTHEIPHSKLEEPSRMVSERIAGSFFNLHSTNLQRVRRTSIRVLLPRGLFRRRQQSALGPNREIHRHRREEAWVHELKAGRRMLSPSWVRCT